MNYTIWINPLGSPEQKEEQRKLRHEYIQSVRANLRAQLNNVSIKNEDGSITPLKPKGLNQSRLDRTY